jgi:Fe2+ or Zn2+ uptake regulation protein
MASHRSYGLVNFVCDECGDGLETERQDYREAVKAAKDEGWNIFTADKEWKHICDSCSIDLEADEDDDE